MAPVLAEHNGAEGHHVILDDPDGTHQLWYLNTDTGQKLAVLLPLDADFRLRAMAAMRLHRRLMGLPAGSPPRGWCLTSPQRRRLILMLNALDAHLAGASYRDIAIALIEPSVADLPRSDWKDSAARALAIRLVTEGVANMNGGYRKLLRGN